MAAGLRAAVLSRVVGNRAVTRAESPPPGPAGRCGLVLLGAAVGDARLGALDARSRGSATAASERDCAYRLSAPRPNPFGASAEVGVAAGPLRGTRLLLRVARWTRLPRGVEVGAELAVDGHVGRSAALAARASRLRPSSSGAPRHRGRAPARAGAGHRAARGAESPGRSIGCARAPSGRSAPGCRAREAALARGMVLGEDERSTRRLARGLARLGARPPARGERPERDAARGARAAVARAGPASGRALGGRARSASSALYVPLAGAGPSLQRAGVMGAAGIAAMTLSRPASRWYALLLAAAVTLALNPRGERATPAGSSRSPRSPGSSRWAARWRPRSPERARSSSGLGARPSRPARGACARRLPTAWPMTVAATLATAPLVAFHFGAVPLAGLRREPPGAARRGARDVARHAEGRPRDGLGGAPAGRRRGRPARADRPGSRWPTSSSSRSGAPICREAGSSCRLHSPARRGRGVRGSSPWRCSRSGAGARGVGRPSSGRASRSAPPPGGAPRARSRVAVLVLVLTASRSPPRPALGSPAPPGDLTVRVPRRGPGRRHAHPGPATAPRCSSTAARPRRPSTAAPRGGRAAARPRRRDPPVARPPGRLPRRDRRMPVGRCSMAATARATPATAAARRGGRRGRPPHPGPCGRARSTSGG